MDKPSIPMIIFAAIAFLYSIPILISPSGQTPFALVSAAFAALTGLCLIAGLIIRIVREIKKDKENLETEKPEEK
jgi:ACR3 family arsenite efflux pump ArsB